MGHPGPNSFERLVNITYGVKIQEPIIVECEACALAKNKKQNRRIFRAIEEAYSERIAVDFHLYLPGIDGYTPQMLLICRKTGTIWDYYFVLLIFEALISAFRSFFTMLEL
jgi:hypothetical protein